MYLRLDWRCLEAGISFRITMVSIFHSYQVISKKCFLRGNHPISLLPFVSPPWLLACCETTANGLHSLAHTLIEVMGISFFNLSALIIVISSRDKRVYVAACSFLGN